MPSAPLYYTCQQTNCNQCHSTAPNQTPPSPCNSPALLHLVLQTSSSQKPILPRRSISNHFQILNLFLQERTCQCKNSCLDYYLNIMGLRKFKTHFGCFEALPCLLLKPRWSLAPCRQSELPPSCWPPGSWRHRNRSHLLGRSQVCTLGNRYIR